MATDVETLQVALTADIKKFEQNMLRMTAVTEARTRTVERRVGQMTSSIRTQSSAAATALSPIPGQVGNISAQFQDVAVQLAGGQSPFLIALQQGTQLSAVLNQAKNPVSALGAAFLQLANPISLATIAAIALGGAAVQWLGNMQGKTETVTERMERHRDTIKQLVAGYDAAERAAESYIEQANKTPVGSNISDAEREQRAAIDRLSVSLDQVLEKRRLFDAMAQQALAFGVAPEVAGQLQQVSALFSQVAADGALSAAEVDQLHTALTQLKNDNAGDQALQEIASSALELINQARQAQIDVKELGVIIDNLPRDVQIRLRVAAEFGSALKELQGLYVDPRSSFDQAREAAKNAADQASATAQSYGQLTGIAAEYQRVIESIDAAEAKANADSSANRESSRLADRAEFERQAVADLIEELQYEQTLLGMTEQQKQVANALRQAGAAATDAQRAAIADLVNTTYLEQQALEATADAMQQFSSTAQQGLQTFLRDISAGKSATEALGNALANIGNQLINAGLSSLFGGGTGSLFSFGGARAAGGPVAAGTSYLVGEKGPELFKPTTSGMIVPTHKIGGQSAGAPISISIMIDAKNADAGGLRGVQMELAKLRSEMPGQVKKIIRDRGHKW